MVLIGHALWHKSVSCDDENFILIVDSAIVSFMQSVHNNKLSVITLLVDTVWSNDVCNFLSESVV